MVLNVWINRKQWKDLYLGPNTICINFLLENCRLSFGLLCIWKGNHYPHTVHKQIDEAHTKYLVYCNEFLKVDVSCIPSEAFAHIEVHTTHALTRSSSHYKPYIYFNYSCTLLTQYRYYSIYVAYEGKTQDLTSGRVIIVEMYCVSGQQRHVPTCCA